MMHTHLLDMAVPMTAPATMSVTATVTLPEVAVTRSARRFHVGERVVLAGFASGWSCCQRASQPTHPTTLIHFQFFGPERCFPPKSCRRR